MRALVSATLVSLSACGSVAVSSSDASPVGANDAGMNLSADAPVATADVRPIPIDARTVPADAPSGSTDARPDPVDAPRADDTPLAYCRATCASVVRCNPGRVAASCELACARQWGNMRLRAGVWRQAVGCASGLSCFLVGSGDGDALFERCVLPVASTLPPIIAANQFCAATDAFNARLGSACRDVPRGAECSLISPLFSDAALDTARGTCFGPIATCASARACMFNALGLPGGSACSRPLPALLLLELAGCSQWNAAPVGRSAGHCDGVLAP